MRLPLTLSLYICRQFAVAIALALVVLGGIVLLADFIELLRRAGGKDQVSFSIILEMALLKFPSQTERLAPFAVLIGSMAALTRLTRSQELVVARAAGVSAWQFLAPAMGVALAAGLILVTLLNPLSSLMLLRFEQVEGRYLSGRPSLLSVSPSGLWLRQMEQDHPEVSEHIIYALRISQQDMSLANVIVFAFDKEQRFMKRVSAENARLEPGLLRLREVTVAVPGLPTEHMPEYLVPTTLTMGHIQDSFASPRTMSVWQLPGFITTLENAGFSALRHRLHLHAQLASPLLLCAMVLIAAIFSLRLPRRGQIKWLIAAGLATGFAMYFFTDLIFALGASGSLPILLAAWAPGTIAAMIGTALLLQWEDG